MSTGSIRKEVSAKLLQSVERAERNIVSKAARKVFESAEVSQCLVLDRKGVTALVLGMEAGIGRRLTPYERKLYRKEVKEYFIRAQKPFPDIPEKDYFVGILRRHGLVLGKNIFYLGIAFDTIKDQYHTFNENFIKEGPKSLKDTSYTRGNSQVGAASEVQFDHGAQGTAVATLGGGSAAVGVALDRGIDFQTLKKVAGANLAAIIDSRFADLSKSSRSKIYERLYDIIINWDQVIGENGTVKAGAGIVVSPRKAKENLGRSSLEKKEVNALLDAIDAAAQDIDWTEVQGSSNLRQKMQKKAVKSFTDPLKKLGAEVKLDAELENAQLKTKNNVKDSSKKGSGVKPKPYKKKRGKRAPAVVAAKGAPKRKKSNVNITILLGLLNSQLTRTVAKNMGDPRLNYRTGRFAGSVRATDIAITAKGHPSIGYTYQRDPYEVFEASSGTRFSSSERDPRKLIDKSIREIAASQAVTMLFTRRV